MKKLNMTKRLIIPIAILIVILVVVSTVSITQLTQITRLSGEVSVADGNVQSILQNKVCHLNWVSDLREAIDLDDPFLGEQDPTKCEFGMWINSDEVASIEDEEVHKYLDEIKVHHNALHESSQVINGYLEEHRLLEAVMYFKKNTEPELDNTMLILEKIEEIFIRQSEEAEAALEAEEQKTKIILIAVSSIGCLLGILLSIIIIRKMIRQLNKNTVSLSKSASDVASAAYQLAAAGQTLSEGATEQAASIEETSATMDETSSMVHQNAENTKQANDLSKQASDSAADGSIQMKKMTRSMDKLKKSSADIAKIIKVIDEIAFQTNMLALNAAVEAARAGDAGLGFAVVAEEVRNLAQKSALAAKDTTEIIDENIDLSDESAVLSKEVNDTLNDIMIKTNDVNKLMAEISKASDEQAKGTEQVTDAIGQMEQVVQQNAATAEESAASAQQMQTQAKELETVVGELEVLVKGAKRQVSDKQIQLVEPIKKVDSLSSTGDVKHIVSPDDVIPLDGEDKF